MSYAKSMSESGCGIKYQRIREITQEVLSHSDIDTAHISVMSFTNLMKQESYSQFMDILNAVKNKNNDSQEHVSVEIIEKPELDPFIHANILCEKLKYDIPDKFDNYEDTIDVLGKIVRRSFALGLEYRVARECAKEIRVNPEKVLESLSGDTDYFVKLNSKFKNFINAIDLMSRHLETLVENIEKEDMFSEMDVPVFVSATYSLFEIVIGRQNKKIRDEDNHVVDDRGIGLGYISSNSFMYNALPEMIPALIEIKKRINNSSSNFKQYFNRIYPAMIEKAYEMDPDYADVVAKSVSNYLFKEEPKKEADTGTGMMFG